MRIFRTDKIFQHCDRISEWFQGGNPYPITVEIDLTDKCNLACKHCAGSFYDTKPKNELSLRQAVSIIGQLRECHVRGLIFTGGGEPTLNPALPDAIGYAKELGLDVALITNGIKIGKIASSIINKCSWVRVSLDASNPVDYKEFKGKWAFSDAVEGIKSLVDAKRSKKSSCTIGVGYLTSMDSAEGMVRATKLCKTLGVDYIQFRPFRIRGERIEPLVGYATVLSEQTKKFMVLYSESQYKRSLEPRGYDKCYGQQFATTICADYKCYVCCHLRHNPKYCLGDLNIHSFAEIWNDERRQEIVDNIAWKDCVYPCRCDPFNLELWKLKQSVEHKNFL